MVRSSDASSPLSVSPEEYDPDNEVLKPNGFAYAAQDSPSSSSSGADNNDALHSQPLSEEGDDEPNSQLLHEANTGPSSAGNLRRTDEETSSMMNNAVHAPGRDPAPLASRSERRAASREGRSATSTLYHGQRPARPDMYEPPTSPPAPNLASSSAQHEAQHEDTEEHETIQPRRSTRVQTQQKHGEERPTQQPAAPAPGEAGRRNPGRPRKNPTAAEIISKSEEISTQQAESPVPVETGKRKRGRPKKNSTAAEIISKRQKIDSANTGRRRSKAEEPGESRNDYTDVDGGSSTSAPFSSSETRQSTSKQAQTALEKLSRIQTQRMNAQDALLDRRTSDASVETSTTDVPTESSFGNSPSQGDLGGLSDLQELLKKIWSDNRGVKKVRHQRDYNKLEQKNESTKGMIRVCQHVIKKLTKIKKSPAELIEAEATQVRGAITSLQRGINEFDVENEDLIKKHLLQELYAYLIPSLLRTLCNIVNFYITLFVKDDVSATVPAPQLEVILGFTSAIIKLDARAKSNTFRVPSQLFIVKPTRHYIIAPLKKFRHKLIQLLTRQNEQEERKHALQIEQRRSERAHLRSQRESEEESRRKALSADWRLLHILRKEAEPDRHLRRHLDWVPPPSIHEPKLIRDVDVNGEPFDRVVMFDHRRTNPRQSSADTQELVGIEWTDCECLALMESLAKYTVMEFRNPRIAVYRKIIKDHCGPGGTLRRFSVSEIVQKSKYIKRMLEDREWAQLTPTF